MISSKLTMQTMPLLKKRRKNTKQGRILDMFILILQVLSIIGIILLAMFQKNYFPKYLEEKAKNTAMKEDIKDITSKVEKVKHNYKIKFDKIQKSNDLLVNEIKDTKNRYNSKQFELYNELWSSLIDLKISANELWNSATGRNLKDFSTKLYSAKISIEKSSLLIEDKHYSQLMNIINKFNTFELGKKKVIQFRHKTIKDVEAMVTSYGELDYIIEQNREAKNSYNDIMDELKQQFIKTFKGETSNKT